MKKFSIILILIIIIILICLIIKQRDSFITYKGFEYSDKFSKSDIEDLKKGQERITKILKEFNRICRKHNLKYWCVGGTLIGILRHKGWIPFDGDIDVGMTQNDYTKLQKIIQNELPKGMWFQDKTSDKYYKSDIGKIRDINSNYKDYKSRTTHNGMQLDIFIFKADKDSYTGENRTFNKKDIFPLNELMFEDIKVFVPNDCDTYLKKFGKNYENYMELPSIKNRYPHEGRVELLAPSWVKEKYPYLYN